MAGFAWKGAVETEGRYLEWVWRVQSKGVGKILSSLFLATALPRGDEGQLQKGNKTSENQLGCSAAATT